MASIQRPRRRHRHHETNRGADQDVELLRTGEYQARIDPNAKRNQASEDEQHRRIYPRPKPAVKGHVERPSNDAGNDCGKKDVD